MTNDARREAMNLGWWAILTVVAFVAVMVFGSLEHLHGATPSERTFLGVIPMFTSTSLAIRTLRSASLKRRLPKVSRNAKA